MILDERPELAKQYDTIVTAQVTVHTLANGRRLKQANVSYQTEQHSAELPTNRD